MMKVARMLAAIALGVVLSMPVIAYADAAEELAQKSVAKANATAGQSLTINMIKSKVDEGCKLIEKEGDAAFPKFQGSDTNFIFAGTYIWIHDLDDCSMRMHPMKYKLNEKPIAHVRDGAGKFLFVEMNKVINEKGAGWVDYLWPKPGEKTPSPKVSYVKLAKHGGKNYVVGCGTYDLTMQEIRVAEGN